MLGPVYLEGTYSEVYPDKSEDEEGMREFFKQFSFPGGIGSHCTPETPGSIHEGGELGYVLSHACGAAFDNPDLIVAAVVGDGEAETGPLATSWHINKFLNPIRDGAVLPILHLNGYKINNPTLLARISHKELESLFRGYGWTPYFVEGSDPESMHQAMAATLEHCVEEIRRIQENAAQTGVAEPPALADDRPALARRAGRRPARGSTATVWKVSGGRTRSPWPTCRRIPSNCNPGTVDAQLQARGAVRRRRPADPRTEGLAPTGTRRMSANPHANGGLLKQALRMPDFRDYAVKVEQPGATRPRTRVRWAASCAT